MRRGLDAFKTFYVEDDDGLHLQSCISPLWDTCLGIIALVDCGVPAEDPAVRKAVDYLLDAQIWTGGDWQVKNKRGRPGGWPFEFVNNLYPDVDDSAVVMNSLLRATPPPGPLSPSTPLRADVNGEGEIKHRVDNAIARGMEWCLSMQSKNGGWGAFDVDNTKRFITQIPFADFGETIDPPSEDVTAHMVEVMGMLGYDRNSAELERGLAYLRATQEPDGAWWGRWGVNYIYGTGAVLQALEAAGEDMRQSYVQRALDWLESVQQPSGAWGEDTHSYVDPSTRGEGAATASQTAWALLGLIAGGRIDSEAVLKGVQWLERTQLQSGTWNEPEYTGTGFPRDFMINYHLYRHYFPMMALGRYVHRTSGGRRVED
jgi:squalene-hopene/tetraprenyl-beta-curcumene cyclase